MTISSTQKRHRRRQRQQPQHPSSQHHGHHHDCHHRHRRARIMMLSSAAATPPSWRIFAIAIIIMAMRLPTVLPWSSQRAHHRPVIGVGRSPASSSSSWLQRKLLVLQPPWQQSLMMDDGRRTSRDPTLLMTDSEDNGEASDQSAEHDDINQESEQEEDPITINEIADALTTSQPKSQGEDDTAEDITEGVDNFIEKAEEAWTENASAATMDSPTASASIPKSTPNFPKMTSPSLKGISKTNLMGAGARESFLSKTSGGSNAYFVAQNSNKGTEGDSDSSGGSSVGSVGVPKGSLKGPSLSEMASPTFTKGIFSKGTEKGPMVGNKSFIPSSKSKGMGMGTLPKVPLKALTSKGTSFAPPKSPMMGKTSSSSFIPPTKSKGMGTLSKIPLKAIPPKGTTEMKGKSPFNIPSTKSKGMGTLPKVPLKAMPKAPPPRQAVPSKGIMGGAASFLKGKTSSAQEGGGFLSSLGKALFSGTKKKSGDFSAESVPYGLGPGKAKSQQPSTVPLSPPKITSGGLELETGVVKTGSTLKGGVGSEKAKSAQPPFVPKMMEKKTLESKTVESSVGTMKSMMPPPMTVPPVAKSQAVSDSEALKDSDSPDADLGEQKSDIETPALSVTDASSSTDTTSSTEQKLDTKTVLPPPSAGDSDDTVAKKTKYAPVEPPLPLTEGITAEEAEAIRMERLAGDKGASTLPVSTVTLEETQVAEGQTAEQAEESRNARLNAADEAANALETAPIKSKAKTEEKIPEEKKKDVIKEPSLPLTEGLTAEEAEAVRNARVAGSAVATDSTSITAEERVTEGQTAEEAEESRNARLDAADAAAKSLKLRPIPKSAPVEVGGVVNEMKGKETKGSGNSVSESKESVTKNVELKGKETSVGGVENGLPSKTLLKGTNKLDSPKEGIATGLKTTGTKKMAVAAKVTVDSFKGGTKSLDGLFKAKIKQSPVPDFLKPSALKGDSSKKQAAPVKMDFSKGFPTPLKTPSESDDVSGINDPADSNQSTTGSPLPSFQSPLKGAGVKSPAVNVRMKKSYGKVKFGSKVKGSMLPPPTPVNPLQAAKSSNFDKGTVSFAKKMAGPGVGGPLPLKSMGGGLPTKSLEPFSKGAAKAPLEGGSFGGSKSMDKGFPPPPSLKGKETDSAGDGEGLPSLNKSTLEATVKSDVSDEEGSTLDAKETPSQGFPPPPIKGVSPLPVVKSPIMGGSPQKSLESLSKGVAKMEGPKKGVAFGGMKSNGGFPPPPPIKGKLTAGASLGKGVPFMKKSTTFEKGPVSETLKSQLDIQAGDGNASSDTKTPSQGFPMPPKMPLKGAVSSGDAPAGLIDSTEPPPPTTVKALLKGSAFAGAKSPIMGKSLKSFGKSSFGEGVKAKGAFASPLPMKTLKDDQTSSFDSGSSFPKKMSGVEGGPTPINSMGGPAKSLESLSKGAVKMPGPTKAVSFGELKSKGGTLPPPSPLKASKAEQVIPNAGSQFMKKGTDSESSTGDLLSSATPSTPSSKSPLKGTAGQIPGVKSPIMGGPPPQSLEPLIEGDMKMKMKGPKEGFAPGGLKSKGGTLPPKGPLPPGVKSPVGGLPKTSLESFSKGAAKIDGQNKWPAFGGLKLKGDAFPSPPQLKGKQMAETGDGTGMPSMKKSIMPVKGSDALSLESPLKGDTGEEEGAGQTEGISVESGTSEGENSMRSPFLKSPPKGTAFQGSIMRGPAKKSLGSFSKGAPKFGDLKKGPTFGELKSKSSTLPPLSLKFQKGTETSDVESKTGLPFMSKSEGTEGTSGDADLPPKPTEGEGSSSLTAESSSVPPPSFNAPLKGASSPTLKSPVMGGPTTKSLAAFSKGAFDGLKSKGGMPPPPPMKALQPFPKKMALKMPNKGDASSQDALADSQPSPISPPPSFKAPLKGADFAGGKFGDLKAKGGTFSPPPIKTLQPLADKVTGTGEGMPPLKSVLGGPTKSLESFSKGVTPPTFKSPLKGGLKSPTESAGPLRTEALKMDETKKGFGTLASKSGTLPPPSLKGKQVVGASFGKGMPFMKTSIASKQQPGVTPLKSPTKGEVGNEEASSFGKNPTQGFPSQSKSMPKGDASSKAPSPFLKSPMKGAGFAGVKSSIMGGAPKMPLKTFPKSPFPTPPKGMGTSIDSPLPSLEDLPTDSSKDTPENTSEDIEAYDTSNDEQEVIMGEAVKLTDDEEETIVPERMGPDEPASIEEWPHPKTIGTGASFAPKAFTPPMARRKVDGSSDPDDIDQRKEERTLPRSRPPEIVDAEIDIEDTDNESIKSHPTQEERSESLQQTRQPMNLWSGESFYGTASSRVYGLGSTRPPLENPRGNKEKSAKDEVKATDADKLDEDTRAPVGSVQVGGTDPEKKVTIAEQKRREESLRENQADEKRHLEEEKRLIEEKARVASLLADAERKMALQLQRIEEERKLTNAELAKAAREKAEAEKKMLDIEATREKEIRLLEKRVTEEMSKAKQKLKEEQERREAERTQARAEEDARWLEKQKELVQERLENRLAEEKAKVNAELITAKQKLKAEYEQREAERSQARAELEKRLADEKAKVDAEMSEEKRKLKEEQEQREAERLEQLNQLVEERLQIHLAELMEENKDESKTNGATSSAKDFLPSRSPDSAHDEIDPNTAKAAETPSSNELANASGSASTGTTIKENVSDTLAADIEALELVSMCTAEFDPKSPILPSSRMGKEEEFCLLPTEYPFVSLLRDSSPYIVNHRHSTIVYHLTGDLISDPNQFNSVIDDIALTWLFGMRIVICVGCRKQILQRLERIHGKATSSGSDSSSMQGVRITDTETLRIVEEEAGFCRFEVERLLNRCLRNKGADCNVVSGCFTTAKRFGVIDGVDYQHTGYPTALQTDRIHRFHSRNDVVLLTPLGFTKEGEALNIHSEALAAFTAGALEASKLVYFSSNPMILRGSTDTNSNQRIQMIQRSNALQILSHYGLSILETGFPQWRKATNFGEYLDHDQQAMLLKMGWATHALDQGVERAHIIDCEDGALLEELFTARRGYGTCISQDDYEAPHPKDRNDDMSIADGVSTIGANR